MDAIINTGPREDSTRIGSQGTVRRQAVDVSPLRRVNQALALLTIGVSIRFPSQFPPVSASANLFSDSRVLAKLDWLIHYLDFHLSRK